MILPSEDECRRVLDLLSDEPELNEWEWEFVESNLERTAFTLSRNTFSLAQKEAIARMMEKYDVA